MKNISTKLKVSIGFVLILLIIGALLGNLLVEKYTSDSWNKVQVLLETKSVERTADSQAFKWEAKFEVVVKNKSSESVVVWDGCRFPGHAYGFEIFRVAGSDMPIGTASSVAGIHSSCSSSDRISLQPGESYSIDVSENEFEFLDSCEKFYVVFDATFKKENVQKKSNTVKICRNSLY